jgi:hypothetical protein
MRFLAMLVLLLQFAPSSHAALVFHVDVDTSVLVGNAGGPFSLDFQLIGGSPAGNSATISNFSFGGGAAAGAPALAGGAAGSLGGSVLLDDSGAFFNEFFQAFTPGATLGFDVSLTTNVNGPTPDGFSFAILDSSLFNITTNGLGDALLFVNIDGASPVVQAFAGIGGFAGVDVRVIPEPAGLVLFALALICAGYAGRRRA